MHLRPCDSDNQSEGWHGASPCAPGATGTPLPSEGAYYEMAEKYSGKASEKERLYIEAGYAGIIERDRNKRLRLLHELAGWVDLKQGRLASAKERLGGIEPLLSRVEADVQKRATLFYRLLEAEIYLAENFPDKAIEAGLRIAPENFWTLNIGDMPY